jgi:hypothetical protein
MIYCIHYILTHTVVNFVGFIYIMDLNNARKMGHTKISITQHFMVAITLFLHTSIYFWGLLVT